MKRIALYVSVQWTSTDKDSLYSPAGIRRAVLCVGGVFDTDQVLGHHDTLCGRRRSELWVYGVLCGKEDDQTLLEVKSLSVAKTRGHIV